MTMSPRGRALLLQFTEPQRYPPLQHVAEGLLADGWDVQLSACRLDDGAHWAFAPALQARVYTRGGPCGGWRGRLNYLGFLWGSGWRMLSQRPRLVWLSDLTATPLVTIARLLGLRVVYHEHDLPDPPMGRIQRWLQRCRQRALRQADALVFPSAQRATEALAAIGQATDARCHIVWNLPGLVEALPETAPELRQGSALRLYFHGSINSTRLPLALLDVMAQVPATTLAVVGYETVGSVGYMERFLKRAADLGLTARVQWHGALTLERRLQVCREQDLGLCFYGGKDRNHQSMVGPSNKPFDYLACRLALLVPDEPEWRRTFVEPGYAYAVPAADPEGSALVALLTGLAADPAAVRARGRLGNSRIRADWHYEQAFATLREKLR